MSRFFFLFAFLLTSCFQQTDRETPVRERLTREVNPQLLDHYFTQALGGPFNLDPQITNYVNRIATRVFTSSEYPGDRFEITILNHSAPFIIPFPNRKIVLTRGLLTLIENEAELASVIAYYTYNSCGIKELPQNVNDIILNALATTGNIDIEKCLIETSSPEDCKTYLEKGFTLFSSLGYDPYAALSLIEKFNSEKLKGYVPHFDLKLKTVREFVSKMETSGYQGKEGYAEMIQPLQRLEEGYLLYELANYSYNKKDYARAEALAIQLLDIEDEEALFHLLLGRCQKKLMKNQQAIASFSRALELNPAYYAPFFERAKLFAYLDKSDRARFDYETAIEYFPSNYLALQLNNLLQ